MSPKVRSRFGKWVTSLLRVGTTKFKQGSVKAVAARFGLRGHATGNRFAKFGIVVLRCYLHFRDSVEIRIDYLDTDDRILIDKVIRIDQSPIKRSNCGRPRTHTGRSRRASSIAKQF